jgi:hypothetical protein
MEKELGAGFIYDFFVCLWYLPFLVLDVTRVIAGLWQQKIALVLPFVLYGGSTQHSCAPWP